MTRRQRKAKREREHRDQIKFFFKALKKITDETLQAQASIKEVGNASRLIAEAARDMKTEGEAVKERLASKSDEFADRYRAVLCAVKEDLEKVGWI